jgi:hypothetical protein
VDFYRQDLFYHRGLEPTIQTAVIVHLRTIAIHAWTIMMPTISPFFQAAHAQELQYKQILIDVPNTPDSRLA